jgi:small subunit ribosomal protein S7
MSSAFIYMIILIFTYICRSTECFAVEISSTYELIKIVKEGSKVPRKGYIAKRDVLPDPMYNSKVVTKLINNVMEDGKRGVAQKICYEAFDIIKEKTGKEPLEVFEAALNNVMPLLEVKARRIGGANYQVPIEVRPERRQTLGLRWLLLAADNRGEKYAREKLANELLEASNNTGAAVKKREDIHKMAEANKAFAHYRY